MPTYKSDIWHEFKIACTILKKSPNHFAKEWGISYTWIRNVADGTGQSKRIRKNIESVVSDAQNLVPFSYPTKDISKDKTKDKVQSPIKSSQKRRLAKV